jgi:hypothetical protein
MELIKLNIGDKFMFEHQKYEVVGRPRYSEIWVYNLTVNCSTLLPQYIKVKKID